MKNVIQILPLEETTLKNLSDSSGVTAGAISGAIAGATTGVTSGELID